MGHHFESFPVARSFSGEGAVLVHVFAPAALQLARWVCHDEVGLPGCPACCGFPLEFAAVDFFAAVLVFGAALLTAAHFAAGYFPSSEQRLFSGWLPLCRQMPVCT